MPIHCGSRLGVSGHLAVSGVVGSGYYRWRKAPVGKRKMVDMILFMHIKDIFKQSRDTYGSYRIHAALADEGIRCGRKRVARLVRENNPEPKAVRRFKAMTTDSKHKLPVAPNVLEQNFTAEGPDQVWLSDITMYRQLRAGSIWRQ